MEGAPSDPDPLNLRQFASWKSRSSSCYEILKLIGVGGYGRVYKARERETGELVALKKIKIYKNLGLQESTRREIKILETLKNEHIIHLKEIIFSPVRKLDDDAQGNAGEEHVRSAFSHLGDLCLVLEYMGHDLEGLSGSGVKFTVPQIKCYMKQLLTGVHYCHVNNVIHRDIKGSNILLSNEGHLKLADFGLARTFSWNDGEGLTDEVVTLWFRSPELLLGETDYGPAVDMWSVGCVFGQLLSGSCLPIFCGDNEKEQFEVICGTCGTPDEAIWPGVSSLPNYEVYIPSSRVERRLRDRFKDLDSHALELLERMLTFNPAQRISAEEALHAEYFRVDPLPCDRQSLPKYAEESHVDEVDRKKRWEEVRQELQRLDRRLAQSGLVYPMETESHYYYIEHSRYKFPDWFDNWVKAGGPSTMVGDIGKPDEEDDDLALVSTG